MRPSTVFVALLLVGCAAHNPAPPRTPERHAANIAAAERAGYRAVTRGDRTIFCPTAPATGSHMASTCLTESEWEAQLGVPRVPSPAVRTIKQSPGPGAGAGH